MYISLHALQSIPPSCLNRDEMNRPKTCVYGQVERMRISSQCFKAAMRKYFNDHIDERWLGFRTKYVPQKLAEEISCQKPELSAEEAMELSIHCLKQLGLKPTEVEEEGEKVMKLSALILISNVQIRKLAEVASRHGMGALSWDAKSPEAKEMKKELVQAMQNGNSVDLALFGRMVADNKTLGVEGCMSVGQIIGVSELIRQDDFYTAVDELNPRQDGGAGMMDDTYFVSDVVYRYASMNTDELEANLCDDSDIVNMVIEDVIRAFVCAEPSARQHSMATHVPPEYVRVELRDTPMSYASAYETPVDSYDNLMADAVEKLEQKVQTFAKAYSKPSHAFVLNLSEGSIADPDTIQCASIDEMVERVTGAVSSTPDELQPE